MKYIILIAFLASLGSILCGYFLNVAYSEKLIGFGVIGLFIVVFPLFAFYRWKGKNIKDYMLTQENLEKMRHHKEK
ncbi:hypothetical protein A9Q86_06200 [Flavobacteriales bacterium 33_180_T64]|nr:hypothetical protein A9Q86_06200 [Flavobacteriales bacterium 33_180_T64]